MHLYMHHQVAGQLFHSLAHLLKAQFNTMDAVNDYDYDSYLCIYIISI